LTGCLSDSVIARLLDDRLATPAREDVLAHAAACPRCRMLVAEATKLWFGSDRPGPSAAEPAAASSAVLIRGASIGRYLILAPLAAGGMGVVYSAYDPDLDRKVALKLLRPGASAQGLQHRLLREAQSMARLSHPNVITVYDVGTLGEQVFLAMELVEGMDLGAWLRDEKRAWPEVLEVFASAGRGLAAAHSAGIVHRDFKPENVLIGRDGRVRVTDFGLARWLGTEPPPPGPVEAPEPTNAAPPQTRAGALVGTPRYMSPEQLAGNVADVRSDIFSFSVSLYEAFFDAAPYPGQTTDEMRRSMDGELRIPSLPSPLPAHLRRALARGLRVDPAERFQSMGELLAELTHDPRRARRRKAMLATATALVGAGIALFATREAEPSPCAATARQLDGIWDSSRREQIRNSFLATRRPYASDSWRTVQGALDAYAAGLLRAYDQACQATWVRHDQSQELFDLRTACLGKRRRALRAMSDLFARAEADVVENAVKAVGSLPPITRCEDVAGLRTPIRPPADEASLARLRLIGTELARAEALRAAGRYREALPIGQAAAGEVAKVGYAPAEAEALLLRARLEYRTGETQRAKATLHEAWARAEAGRDDRRKAQALEQLAYMEGIEQSRPAEGLRWARLARAALARVGGEDRIEAEILRAEAGIYWQQDQFNEALKEIERALSLAMRAYGTKDYRVARMRSSRALVLGSLIRRDEALREMLEALSIERASLGGEHPRVAATLNNLGILHTNAGRYQEAEASFREALRIRERVLGPDHPLHAMCAANLGHLFEGIGQPDKAVEFFRRALPIQERAYGPDDPLVADSRVGYANALLGQGKLQEALRMHEIARVVFEKKNVRRAEASALVGIAEVKLALARPAEARAAALRAAEILRTTGSRGGERGTVRFLLARVLWGSGDQERAIKLALEAKGLFAKDPGGGRARTRANLEQWLRQHATARGRP
jgi:tetratricopeptide (TPR) repeat protein